MDERRREAGSQHDAIDEIVEDLREHVADSVVLGLPILGRVMRLARHLEHRREEQLVDYGLTLADFDMLATMWRKRADSQAINVREFQRSLMLSSGGVTKRLDRLEGAGYIERRLDPNDRRGVLIALTSAGQRLIAEALPAILRSEAALVESALPSGTARTRVEGALRQMLIEQERS